MRYVEEGKYLFIRSGGEIAAQPQVNEVAVVPVPSEFAEEEVMCVIAPIPGESIDPKELLEFLVPRLPHFMVPRYVRIVDALPKTPTQKVQKHLLRSAGLTDDTWDREKSRHQDQAATTLENNHGQGDAELTKFVTIEKSLGPEGRIAVVRFDRGDGINALSPEVQRQLIDAARSFEDDAATSVVVLTGGAKSFTAGFDLKDPEGRARRTMDIGALRRHLKLGPRLTRAWQEMEQITIGAIEGFCIGGGVALAVALDFRIMGRDAHMRVPEIGLGMNMSWQSIPRMLHLMGPARTKQAVILADQRISAAEAYEWGLVEEVADPGKAFDAAMILAAKVAAQPPLSVAMTKLTVNRLAHALDDLAGHMDVDQFALASFSEDHKEGVAAFLERRKPRFKGR